MTTLLIRNASLTRPGGETGRVDVAIADTRIAAIDSVGDGEALTDVVLDAGGRTLIPGLIDLHVHGAGGADVMDGTPEAIATVARTLARTGTTGFLATTFVTPDTGSRHLPVLAEAVGRPTGGALLLGIHLEGPFINPERRGGIPAGCLLDPSTAALDEVLALTDGTLTMMTIAPELRGVLPVIERLAGDGIVPSFGHSDATYDETRTGIRSGIRHATHLYNVMRGFHHRDPGPLVALYETDDLPVQLIADDVHVADRVIRWTREVFGHERCVCITDGMRTIGLPDGEYRFGELQYVSRDGAARYLDGTLIGTSLSLLDVVHRFREYTGCSLAEAAETGSLHAARALGIEDRKGTIAPGKDADLVILDSDGSVWATLVEGEVAYRKDD
jgi:N-acetylglucosamine-6-phosphate deacetylase